MCQENMQCGSRLVEKAHFTRIVRSDRPVNNENSTPTLEEVQKEVESLKRELAVQSATQAGALATISASQAGQAATTAATQAGQAATTAAAQAGLATTTAAAQAGTITTVGAGFVALVVGVFIGLTMSRHR